MTFIFPDFPSHLHQFRGNAHSDFRRGFAANGYAYGGVDAWGMNLLMGESCNEQLLLCKSVLGSAADNADVGGFAGQGKRFG